MRSSGRGREPGLRERKKIETRRGIQEHALRLFLAQGYEATTVEEIAAAAGVSHMTFFRYFPTKEAVVADDDYDALVPELIQRRPPDEDPLTTIRHALLDGLATLYERDRRTLLARTRLILTTPALRSRLWENQHATVELFTRALTTRQGLPEPTLAVRVQAAAALAAVTAALGAWVDSRGEADLPQLVNDAFDVLHRP
ncbi:acyl-CoA-like ligand-binding transcription factor [Streptoalloteichus hindustanus]|uniref:Transcriptional regulator, TetR family n=1 Tax=Streptoalloteichus hindustanus TaxID=2017 RepID=A0A1M5ESN3_STRHI|nr:TetR family transcriptional regulator [Streptoalloteichus hindustanus]SHF82265.1 transcriptional regulator, TetR family [Streptoalloteichus hindustanus]